MPRHDFTQDELRDYLLMRLNRRQHWVFVCIGEGGRFLATEIRRRQYAQAKGRDWEEIVLPGQWISGGGLLPVAVGHRKHMTAADLAAIMGEFARTEVPADNLEGRRIIVCGDAMPAMQNAVLNALNGWLTARPNYQKVGVE